MAKTKRDGGEDFTSMAYLIVPDANLPSGWKIRIEEAPGKVTQAQLGRAAAALSGAGFRGNKLKGVSDADKSAAKRKLRALYKKNDWDVPESLKASEAADAGTALQDASGAAFAEVDGEPSFDDVRCMIQDLLTDDRDCCCPGPWPWVVDVGAASCIVQVGDDTWRYPYTVDGDDVTLGEPVAVRLSWRDLTPAEQAEEGAEGEQAPVPMQAGERLRLAGRLTGQAEPGTMAFVTDLRGLAFSDSAQTVPVEVCRDGEWDHPEYGKIAVTPETREAFVRNFSANVRRVGDLPLDYDHSAGPASGWVRGLRNEGSRLLADVALTDGARQRVASGEYRFFSPEWHPDWKDPETGKRHGPTLFGGGLTNRPFFRGMAAISCSEISPSTGGDGRAPSAQGGTMPENDAGAQTGADTLTGERGLTAAEAQQMRDRLTAVEAHNSTLIAAEQRRVLTDTITALKFNEGRAVMAPGARDSLVDALMPLPEAQRAAVVEALKGVRFADLSVRGFVPAENGDGDVSLTASEREHIAAIAKTMNVKPEEAEKVFREQKQARQAPVLQ